MDATLLDDGDDGRRGGGGGRFQDADDAGDAGSSTVRMVSSGGRKLLPADATPCPVLQGSVVARARGAHTSGKQPARVTVAAQCNPDDMDDDRGRALGRRICGDAKGGHGKGNGSAAAECRSRLAAGSMV